MTNGIAISAVTAFLSGWLQDKISDGRVKATALPLDRANEGAQDDGRINLFLYHAELNPHWRNHDLPWRTNPNEQGRPPLPLNLYYLLTAYYGNDDESVTNDNLTGTHLLMGNAMRLFHDNCVMSRKDIQDAFPPDANDTLIFDQIENIRITPQPLSLDEMSKIWTTFQAPYRFSFAYEVAVLFIESDKTPSTPLPVLKRGEQDQGVISQPNVLPPFPTIEAVNLPIETQQAAVLGEVIELTGHHLIGETFSVQFEHTNVETQFTIPNGGITAVKDGVSFDLPNDPNLPAGVYLATLNVDNKPANQISIYVAPTIVNQEVTPNGAGNIKATVSVEAGIDILSAQNVSLLIGGQAIPRQEDDVTTRNLIFEIPNLVSSGSHFIRLRVDGVDSPLIIYDDDGKKPVGFDPELKVTI